jgi:hypothetical protein
MTHNPEECKSIFVSWAWALTTLAGCVVVLVSLAWAGSSHLTKANMTSINHEYRIKSVEYDLKDINAKLDTLLMRTR